MRSLPELQRDFSRLLFDPRAKEGLEEIDGNGLAPGQRLQIYRNNLFISLTEALAADYPVVQRLVGDDFFSHAAREFIQRHPSRSGNLHDFGAAFPEFIGSLSAAANHAYLADVAALERAWQEAYHAASHGPFDPGVLAGMTADRYGRLRFSLHPSARIVRSDWPILRIWTANQPGSDGGQTIDLDAGGESVLAIRPEFEVRLVPLERAEATWIGALAGGATLEHSLRLALHEDPGFDLNHMLGRHVRLGTLVEASG